MSVGVALILALGALGLGGMAFLSFGFWLDAQKPPVADLSQERLKRLEERIGEIELATTLKGDKAWP